MNYLLDTNILLIYGRDSKIAGQIEEEYGLFSGDHNLAISVVTLGELNSLAKQFRYGERKRERLERLVENTYKIDINFAEIIEKYGELDAFSQGKLVGKPLGNSSRNMGKNDLWIAATASVFNMVLVTIDKDFQHLDKNYLTIIQVDLSQYS